MTNRQTNGLPVYRNSLHQRAWQPHRPDTLQLTVPTGRSMLHLIADDIIKYLMRK